MFNTFLEKCKGSWKSLTIWFNGLMVAALPFLSYLQDSFVQVKDYLGDDIYKTFGLLIVSVNLALRFKTTKDLADK